MTEVTYSLAKVTRVVLLGCMLKPEAGRLIDVDVAVELARKEPDFDRAQEQNRQRVEVLANLVRRFRVVSEWEGCWYWEAFRFLKGRSRVIALADFTAEKTFVLAVSHRFLIGEPEKDGGTVVADHARGSGSEAAPAQLPVLNDLRWWRAYSSQRTISHPTGVISQKAVWGPLA